MALGRSISSPGSSGFLSMCGTSTRSVMRRGEAIYLTCSLDWEMEQFGTRHYRSISAWLDPNALQTTRGVVLAEAVVEELRKRLIVLPPVAVIERLCAEAMAGRLLFHVLRRSPNLNAI